jgi:single-stranded DNA-binding protein
MAVNTTTQIGNLVGVEYKTSANGNSYIRARLAVNMGQEKESSWFNVVAFNELAQNTYETWMKSVENSSKNSVRAMVQGKIEVSNYGEGEEKKVSVTIIADEIGIATKYAVVTGLEPMSGGISTDNVQVQKAAPEAKAAMPEPVAKEPETPNDAPF